MIFVAGFRSRQSAHDHLYSRKITIPSLHVFGYTDRVIPKGRQQNMLHEVYISIFTQLSFGLKGHQQKKIIQNFVLDNSYLTFDSKL